MANQVYPLATFGKAGLFVINQPSHPAKPPLASLTTTHSITTRIKVFRWIDDNQDSA